MLIDTHCHLDAPEFDADRDDVAMQAQRAGVRGILIPAIGPGNFAEVQALAHRIPGGAYALGIHPLCVHRVADDALKQLRRALQEHQGDPRLVAVGEIGLDRFVKEVSEGEAWERQQRFFMAQLRLAVEFELPVILHVRRTVDLVTKGLRQVSGLSGIAHAFNGSRQQADILVDMGLALGVGGAMTFTRALQIRRIAQGMPLEHLVLETDSPDIPPAWLTADARRNTPSQVAGVAAALAELRGITVEDVLRVTGRAAVQQIPRLARCLA